MSLSCSSCDCPTDTCRCKSRHFVEQFGGGFYHGHCQRGTCALTEPHFQVEQGPLVDKIEQCCVAWLARLVPGKYEIPDAWLNGIGEGCSSGRDEAVHDNRYSARCRAEDQSCESCDL